MREKLSHLLLDHHLYGVLKPPLYFGTANGVLLLTLKVQILVYMRGKEAIIEAGGGLVY